MDESVSFERYDLIYNYVLAFIFELNLDIYVNN